jgi:hypothetical protein
MTEVWPLDAKKRLSTAASDTIRPFRCVLLMPFGEQFDEVAAVIHDTVSEEISRFGNPDLVGGLPNIERLDWVTSSGAIQQQIWQRIFEADLVFCDITSYNPNVMFEGGVCAAWKDVVQVVFIKDRSFKVEAPFDIKPMRYTEYELTYTGIKKFREKLSALIRDALIGYPDRQGANPSISLPFQKDFSDEKDDLAICTPPFAHRRVIDNALEFGSLWAYSHSWATIGKENFHTFELEFTARFRNQLPNVTPFIGVGLRSQHYYANYAHLLYLDSEGKIIITEPNEQPPKFYSDHELRGVTSVDLDADHLFRVRFDEFILRVQVDDFEMTFKQAEMKKVLGPGLIRFQSSMTWMAIRRLRVSSPVS